MPSKLASITTLFVYLFVRRCSRFNCPRHHKCNPSFQFTAPPLPIYDDSLAEVVRPATTRVIQLRCRQPFLQTKKVFALRLPISKLAHQLPSDSSHTVQTHQSCLLPCRQACQQVHISAQAITTAGWIPTTPAVRFSRPEHPGQCGGPTF